MRLLPVTRMNVRVCCINAYVMTATYMFMMPRTKIMKHGECSGKELIECFSSSYNIDGLSFICCTALLAIC